MKSEADTVQIPAAPMEAGVRGASIADELRRNWRTMACIIAGMFITLLPGSAFSVFIGPLSQTFGWSVRTITLWSLIWSVGTILSAPLLGGLADHFGARRVVLGSLTGLSVIWAVFHAQMNSLFLFYLSAFLLGVVISGSSSVTYGRIASRRFRAGLGTAFGLMSCGTGLAAVAGPSMMEFIIARHGWREAFVVAGLLALALVPIMFKWLDREPKAAPTTVIATAAATATPATVIAAPGLGYSLQEAVRMPVFWVIAVGTILYGVCTGGVNVNLVPFLTSEGFSTAAAASLIGLYGLASLVGRFATGIVIDRLSLNAATLMAFVLLIQAAAFAMLPLTTGPVRLAALLVYGLTVGAEADCLAYCVAKIFGERYFGRIYGLVGFTMLYVGLGVGPFLFALTRDLWGNYDAAFFGWAGLALAALPLFLVAGRAPLIEQRSG